MLNLGVTFQVNHGAHKVPWFTLLITGIVLWLYFLGNTYFEKFIFDKQLILNGEVWRIITGHFVHSNFEHLFWDLLGFIILGLVIERHHAEDLIPSFLISCLFVSTGLFVYGFGFSAYCGLSGALNGLLVVAVMSLWKNSGSFIYGGVLLGAALKIMFELLTRHTVFTNLSLQAVPEAHAIGFFAGFIYLLLKRKKQHD